MTARYSPLRMLLTGPNEPLLRLVRLALHLEEWVCEMTLSYEAFFAHLDQGIWDLIIWDCTLWQDVVQVTQAVRSQTTTPLLLLMQREQRQEQQAVIAEGADGYLTMPFSLKDLVDQVYLLLGVEIERVPVFKAETISSATRTLRHEEKVAGWSWQKGQKILLTPIEARILFTLVHHAGQGLPAETLLVQIWGTAYRFETHLLAAYMQRLCTKLENDPLHPQHIQSLAEDRYVFTP